MAAHQSNLAEISAGKLAEQKGAASRVRSIGARFIADHTKLDVALTALAKADKVALPSTPNVLEQATAGALAARIGTAFDAFYLRSELTGHQMTLAAGATEIRSGSNSAVIGAAKAAAPVVTAHIVALKAAEGALGVSAPTGVNAGTGGHAATVADSSTVLPLIAGGVMVAGAGVWVLRRRASAR